MRIIQTFWSKNFKIANLRGGWLSEEAHLMCWALSCLNAKRLYGNIELYTDNYGYELLVEKMKLPYDKVHIVFEENNFLDSIPSELWALGKVYTYSLQDEPFIHIDGDFIFWKKIEFKNNIIFQNLEIEVGYYKMAYDSLKEVANKFSDCSFLDSIKTPLENIAANMGIFGIKDVSFVKQYATNVLHFIEKNLHQKSLLAIDAKNKNCFFEQYYLYFLCRHNNISFDTIHPEYYDSPKKNKLLFFQTPDENNSFNHFLGNGKSNESINDFVKYKLQKYYPDTYAVVKNIASEQNSLEPYYCNLENLEFDSETIIANFARKLFGMNLLLSNDLYEDCSRYWMDKSELLESNNNSQPKCSPNVELLTDSSIKLNSNFISIEKYMLPWDKLISTDFQRERTLREIEEENLENSSTYCIFAYTPFERSICSLWITDLHAYIVSKIMSREFQNIAQVAAKVQKLLKKTDSDSSEKIKTLLIKFLKELTIYELIDIKNHSITNPTDCARR